MLKLSFEITINYIIKYINTLYKLNYIIKYIQIEKKLF